MQCDRNSSDRSPFIPKPKLVQKMKTAKLTTTTGYTWKTSISSKASDELTVEYFMGKFFDVGEYPKEKLERVVKVEIFNPDTLATTVYE
jgi:hypothetical protein